jgi:uncharacterized protein YjbI with pentapeptide repeats
MTLAGDATIGFAATRPLGTWNQRLGVDYPGVFKAVLKATLAAATANAPGMVSSAIDGFFAFRMEDARRPPEELAWLLIRRALAHAMAKLAIEALKRHDREPDDPDGLVAQLDASLDGAEVPIDHEFVECPGDHPIVGRLVDPFQAWLRAYGLNDAETRSVTRRLGAYFTLALHREWADHADEYRLLEAKLVETATPFARANAIERAWLKNAAYLQRLIREPVFYEPFGLHDVYVALRAYYVEGTGDEADFNQVQAERQPPERRRVAVDLRAECLRWLKADDRRNPVRLISGDPGCGKTSFAKELAAELTDAWPEAAGAARRVLFVPLHRFNFTGDLQLTLRNYLSGTGILPRDYDPLDAVDGASRLLIFFDGLDEISEQGRPGREAIQKLAGQVDILARTLNHAQPRVFFVLGGRHLAIDASRQHFQQPRQVLHVLPYRIADPEHYQIDPDTGPAQLGEDLRQVWWQKYAAATGKPYDGLPDQVDRGDLEPITSQPLLNYLLAQSLERGELDFSAQITLNHIYGDLLKAVYERHWGDPETTSAARGTERRLPLPGHPALKPLSWDDFVRLLEEVALLAWHGTGRTVPASAVESACEELRLKDKLEAFKQGTEAGAVSLLVSFFFRQAEQIGGEPSFEFTHKSFGEYLTARRLVRAIATTHDQRDRNRRDPDDGWTTTVALERWARMTGSAAVDLDLLGFLARQISLQQSTKVGNWQGMLAELFGDQLKRGLPMHKLGLPTFQEMTRQARNSEETLLAAHSCCVTSSGITSDVLWPHNGSFRAMLLRLGTSPRDFSLVRQCVNGLNLREASFFEEFKRSNCFYHNTIRLPCVNLDHSDLRLTVLTNSELFAASFRRTLLGGAELDSADLYGADLSSADLSSADLSSANLEGANLEGANLEGANLEGANLEGANLERANLGGANLGGANLEGVLYVDEARNLNRVASWRGARIERKWVEKLGLDAEKLGIVVVDDMAREEGSRVAERRATGPGIDPTTGPASAHPPRRRMK